MSLAIIQAPSRNFNERLHPLDMLVLHYTGMKDGPSALARMQEDKEPRVSAHYMVEEDGRVFQLVAEDKRAWQAGRSWWRGDEDLNSRSIGIEIVNPGHEFGYRPFPDQQIGSVIGLCKSILSRWPIPQNRIVAHSDIAPDRKEDPGEFFPWQRLASEGIGIWPGKVRPEPWMMHGVVTGDAGVTVERLQNDLATIGYKVPSHGQFDDATAAVVRAFQRRWRQSSISGEGDPETVSIAHEVARLSQGAAEP
jgi:N-acetylmuramoyl-L-alanine amidase